MSAIPENLGEEAGTLPRVLRNHLLSEAALLLATTGRHDHRGLAVAR